LGGEGTKKRGNIDGKQRSKIALKVADNFRDREILTSQPPQEFAFIHSVLEGLTPVDEDDWNFVIELPAQLRVAIYIHFLPGKSAAPRELSEAFFYYFAKVATFA
jgi:hypothetical protein